MNDLEERNLLEKRPYVDFDYPRVLELTRSGTWSVAGEDFFVEEVQLYPFCGEGEHAALVVEKKGVTTRDLAKAVGARLGVGPAAVGYAGMKDKAATCVQAFTITGADEAVAAEAFVAEGARVLTQTRHTNKLRLGHLAANRFKVLLRGGDEEAAGQGLAKLAEVGVPNYFGPQRFGQSGDNAIAGLRLLRGGRRVGRWKRDLLISALQSVIFNEVLARRIEADEYLTALSGDVMKKVDSGGVFVCEDEAVDQQRLDSFEISPTGPMNGKKMVGPKGGCAEREEAVLADLGLEAQLFSRQTGTRRPLRSPLSGCETLPDEAGVWICFACPPGVYATSVVREIAASGAKRVVS
jgi:tRNA pseudouridine13 synthase